GAENLPDPGCAAQLPAAYQWLVPDCDDINGYLTSVGLPHETIKAVMVAAAAHTDQTHPFLLRTSFAYNLTGHPSDIWHKSGHTRFERDSDGRPVHITDNLGRETTVTYNVFGLPTREEISSSDGQILHQSETRY